jgi:perosamine synthetase
MKFEPNSNSNAVMEEGPGKIVMFKPFIPPDAVGEVEKVLNSRWIGQGPKVEEFEKSFSRFINTETHSAISVNSGTAALHLAYILCGLDGTGNVLAPALTCTATNIPLLYDGNKLKWIDTEKEELNVSVEDIKIKIDSETKAVVIVNYGGVPADIESIAELCKTRNIPLIQDSAHALGAKINDKNISEYSDFSIYSFQAIKHITTGDGGILVVPKGLEEKAKRLRWFGIDRNAKKNGVWDNDLLEVGYKYHMNDIAAALGISALNVFDKVIEQRQELHKRYELNLANTKNIRVIPQDDPIRKSIGAAWLCNVIVEDRESLRELLFKNLIECGMVHYRNDNYSIFSDFKSKLSNLDSIESKYLALPLHNHLSIEDVDFICQIINKGW